MVQRKISDLGVHVTVRCLPSWLKLQFYILEVMTNFQPKIF